MNYGNCPKCGKANEIELPDRVKTSKAISPDLEYDYVCMYCDEAFVYKVRTVHIVESFKRECLNNAKHSYKPTITNPREFTMMKCIHCDKIRELNDSERGEYV